MAWSKEYNLILSILNQEDGVMIDPYGIDVENFLDKAREEGLSGLLFKNLKEKGLLYLFPATIQKSLRGSYLLTLSRNMILMKDLEGVISSLEEKRVRTIVLKGPALLERVYQDRGVRPVTDIDLLLYDEDEATHPCTPLDRGEVGRIFEDIGYHLASIYPRTYENGRTVLDIHTDVDSFTRFGPIPYSPKLRTSDLWADSLPWKDGFEYVRILSPEDTILTLSIHLMKHSFLRLLWLIDIIEVIKRNPEIDWNKLKLRAKETGFEKLLFYVFFYIRQIFSLIPEGFLSEIKPKKLGFIEKGVIERIIKNQRYESYGDILYLYMIDGFVRRFLFALKILLPSREKLVEMGESEHPFLYYKKRILDLSKMAGKVLWHYIAGNRSTTHRSPIKNLGDRLYSVYSSRGEKSETQAG